MSVERGRSSEIVSKLLDAGGCSPSSVRELFEAFPSPVAGVVPQKNFRFNSCVVQSCNLTLRFSIAWLAAKHQTHDTLTVPGRFDHSLLKPFVGTRIRFKLFPDSLHG